MCGHLDQCLAPRERSEPTGSGRHPWPACGGRRSRPPRAELSPPVGSRSNRHVLAVLRSVRTRPPPLSHWPNSGPRTATVSWLQSSPVPSVGKHPSRDPNKQLLLGAELYSFSCCSGQPPGSGRQSFRYITVGLGSQAEFYFEDETCHLFSDGSSLCPVLAGETWRATWAPGLSEGE